MMEALDVARPRVPFDPIAGSTAAAYREAPKP
jgi:hypothetical protein